MLLDDGTYYVLEASDEIVACGGLEPSRQAAHGKRRLGWRGAPARPYDGGPRAYARCSFETTGPGEGLSDGSSSGASPLAPRASERSRSCPRSPVCRSTSRPASRSSTTSRSRSRTDWRSRGRRCARRSSPSYPSREPLSRPRPARGGPSSAPGRRSGSSLRAAPPSAHRGRRAAVEPAPTRTRQQSRARRTSPPAPGPRTPVPGRRP